MSYILNKTFGKLLVIENAGRNKHGHKLYKCKCDCGTEKIVRADTLLSGKVSSCGCSRGNHKHGMSRTSTYQCWNAMLARCTNSNDSSYKDYGGRGIIVCKEWYKFENFYSDMGERPEGLSLERIDNNGNYEPNNCRWATRIEQQNNRRSNLILTLNGESHNITEWANKLKVNENSLRSRLSYGWTIEETLTLHLNQISVV